MGSPETSKACGSWRETAHWFARGVRLVVPATRSAEEVLVSLGVVVTHFVFAAMIIVSIFGIFHVLAGRELADLVLPLAFLGGACDLCMAIASRACDSPI